MKGTIDYTTMKASVDYAKLIFSYCRSDGCGCLMGQVFGDEDNFAHCNITSRYVGEFNNTVLRMIRYAPLRDTADAALFDLARVDAISVFEKCGIDIEFIGNPEQIPLGYNYRNVID